MENSKRASPTAQAYCVLLTGPSRLGRFFVLACIASKVLSSLSTSPRSALTCKEKHTLARATKSSTSQREKSPYRCLAVTRQLALPLRLAFLGTLQLVFLLGFVVVREVITVCCRGDTGQHPTSGGWDQALDDALRSLSFRPRCTAEVWNADDVDGRRGEDCTTRRELARREVMKDMMMTMATTIGAERSGIQA